MPDNMDSRIQFLAVVFYSVMTAAAVAEQPGLQRDWIATRSLPAAEAHQAAAADNQYFYAIASAQVGKYDRRSGERSSRRIGYPSAELSALGKEGAARRDHQDRGEGEGPGDRRTWHPRRRRHRITDGTIRAEVNP